MPALNPSDASKVVVGKHRFGLLAVLGSLVVLTVCGIILWEVQEEETIMSDSAAARKASIEKVKEKYETQLLNIEGVEGVGIGEESGRPVIKVYVVKKTKTLQGKIPARLEGYPVSMEVTGEFHAF